jgi:adenylate cyclase
VRADAMSAAAVAGLPQVALPAQPTSLPRGIVARLFDLIGFRGSQAAATSPSSSSVTGTGKADKPAAAPLTVPRLSIVVLPFANLSNDPDQEYFADGITDDLTTDLSRISDSFVIARNTAFTYKNKPVDVRQVGRELGVRYVLESSLRRMGDQVQVNVQLVDADSGSHVWADRFDTDRRNLAEAQSETEITGRLARTLEFELVRQASHRIEQAEADNPDARDLVLRARALIHRPAAIAIREEARRLFERGLEIDPGSIDAKIGLATLLITTIKVGWSNSAQQDQARAEQLLVEVLERDAN